MEFTITKHIVIDYEKVYGTSKPIEEVAVLIKDIPSETLLNYIAFFNVKIYQNTEGPEAHNVQIQLLNNLLNIAAHDTVEAFKNAFKEVIEQGDIPTFIWRKTNLLFFEQIFKNFNELPERELTQEDAKNILDAYLILNTKGANHESVTIEFASQLMRGAKFFGWLEMQEQYAETLNQYYENLHIGSYKEIFGNILNIFTLIRVDEGINNRSQIIDLNAFKETMNIKFVANLTVNTFANEFINDTDFSTLKKHPLYELKGNPFVCLVLDVEYIVDKLFIAHINELNNYYNEFLRGYYFPFIMNRCFQDKPKANFELNGHDVLRVSIPNQPDTFINLSFFELFEEFIKKEPETFYKMIPDFHNQKENKLSFEHFSRGYIKKHSNIQISNPPLLLEAMKDLFPVEQEEMA